MSAKKTGWFSGDVKPVHVGVYERDSRLRWSYWNGREFCSGATTRAAAYANRRLRSLFQRRPWRGLATPPESNAIGAEGQKA